jgi:hypothetical protein
MRCKKEIKRLSSTPQTPSTTSAASTTKKPDSTKVKKSVGNSVAKVKAPTKAKGPKAATKPPKAAPQPARASATTAASTFAASTAAIRAATSDALLQVKTAAEAAAASTRPVASPTIPATVATPQCGMRESFALQNDWADMQHRSAMRANELRENELSASHQREMENAQMQSTSMLNAVQFASGRGNFSEQPQTLTAVKPISNLTFTDGVAHCREWLLRNDLALDAKTKPSAIVNFIIDWLENSELQAQVDNTADLRDKINYVIDVLVKLEDA